MLQPTLQPRRFHREKDTFIAGCRSVGPFPVSANGERKRTILPGQQHKLPIIWTAVSWPESHDGYVDNCF